MVREESRELPTPSTITMAMEHLAKCRRKQHWIASVFLDWESSGLTWITTATSTCMWLTMQSRIISF